MHLATITPSILAPVQLARPGRLPRQATPPQTEAISWVALGMLMHFALTMLWRLAKAGFMLRLRVHSLKANGGHIASIRS